MAFEVKVYREVTAYQAKVMFGLSWRQFGIAAIGIPVVGVVFAACYMLGQENLGVVLTFVFAIPFIAIGWVRPMGVPYEQYARHAVEARKGHKRFTFYQRDPFAQRKEGTHEALARTSRKARRRYGAFEATN